MKQLARIVGITVAVAVAALAFLVNAAAQSYPVKPIRLVVPVAAGGNLDLIGRSVAQRLTENLGRQVVVENRIGASSIIGTENVARSAPDGYTFLIVSAPFVIAPRLIRNAPYDPVRDFTGVSLIALLTQMMVVHPSLPVKSVADLVALAKARPGALNCATSGNGSGSHMAMELFNRQAGVRMTRIPYNGDAPALVDLIGGQVTVKFDNLSTSIPLVRTGKLRALGVTSPRRSTLLPDVPAISETLPGYSASIFNGMAAPVGTPKEIISRIHGEVVNFVQIPDVRNRFAQQGVELQSSASPEQFTEFIKSEYARWGKVIQEADIKAE